MKKMQFIYALCLLFLGSDLQAQQPVNIETQLFNLPDVVFKRIETPEGFHSAWELKIRQPLDHKNPGSGYFYQRAFLSHMDFSRPLVLCTEGYQRPRNRIYELTELLSANQIDVEHRYFGESVPDSLDYRYLTLEQVAGDLHHINLLFRQIYEGKWLSTGISKGGQTTIYYRYFYPEDVDVSVPYVAPLNLSLEEKRIYDFLDTVGTDECRQRLYQTQVRLLKNRKEVLSKLHWFNHGAGLKFTYLSQEQAFEYAVLEYPFSFWQWGHSCESVPDGKAPLDSVIHHLLKVSGLDFFSDESMKNYASHYYQAGTEMGYYGYNTAPFKGLLKALPEQPHPSAVFMPDKLPLSFDGELPRRVHEWLQMNGNHFIYINGNSDTWSATAVRPSGKTNAVFFFMPEADHAKARIKNMSAADRQQLVATLGDWLDMEIE